jgi:hypothetical protein
VRHDSVLAEYSSNARPGDSGPRPPAGTASAVDDSAEHQEMRPPLRGAPDRTAQTRTPRGMSGRLHACEQVRARGMHDVSAGRALHPKNRHDVQMGGV